MAFIRGTRRGDFLEGTSRSDLIFGRSGDDEILGGGGRDWIFGGRGKDTIDGEDGNDWLFGGDGDDEMRGGDGRDRMFGGRGNDDMFGGDGNDYMVGGSGRDSMFGGEGRDTIYGDDRFSFRRGGDDDDDGGRRGGDDDDDSRHKAFDDFLDGGADDDKLFGGRGDDTLDGGEGADKMVGGTGDDTYFVDDAGDSVIEKSRQGTDEVFSSVDYTLADNVENLTLLNGQGVVRSSYETDFEGFSTGVSIDGQDGWGVAGPPTFDESVEDDSGNTVWRISNAVTSGAFGNQPFAPRPAGIVADTTTDPVNGDPDSFAGESSTGANSNRFFAQFDFTSATGAAQPGLSITVSPDNGSGARHGFFDLQDTGSGLEVVTFDLDSDGNFIGPITIADGLSYTDFHTIGIEILFKDGPDNDLVNYFLDGELIHTGPSWEQFYTNFQDAQHPLGVPVQSLIFRVSGAAEASVDDEGFLIDNLSYEIGSSAADLNGTGNDLDNTITGNDGNNILSGLAGEDVILGNDGDDNLIGGEDDDELDGGGGNDTATFSGDAGDYDVTVLPDGRIQVSDNVPGRDGTDTLENIEQLDFNGNVLPLGPVLVFDAGNTFVGGFATIQAGVDASSGGFTVLVTPGTYNENVEIDSSITLLSTGGRENTIIQGSAAPGGAETGTVYIIDDTDNVQVGDVSQGFTIVGFDNPAAPGIETAAVYVSGDQSGLSFIGNEIVADGEAGLLTEFGATIDGLTIDKNVFSGTTFDPSQPVSETQWTTNFPWAMLFVGNAPIKSNIVVTDNAFEGQTAGQTASGETFGNIAATVDATGATITGNTFATDANNFGLRARGTDTEVSDNTFDNSGDGNTTGFTLGSATPSGPYADNVFVGGENGDVFFGTPGDDDVSGNDGGDFLGGGLGDDNIDGGDGNDTAFFQGFASDYSFVFGIDGNPISATDTNAGDGDEGTDTLTSIENVFFLSEDPVQVFDTSGNFVAAFTTIQAGIDAALDGYTVLVGPGTYVENIEIVDKDISVFSVAGRDSTIIEGIPGSALGTVFLGGSTDGVEFGREGQGFKVIGIDGPPGIEKGAFYASSGAPGHTNLAIEGNEFVANGDSALTFEFNDNFDGVTIEGNIFSGFTFDPTQPIGDPSTFANQFTTENVARQLVVIGGGAGVTNTQNVDFINNEITGTSGGVVAAGETFNDAGTPTVAATDLPFGNTMVTIDVVGGSVSGNSFTGTTGRFGAGLRVRGPGTDITDNTFDNGDGGDSRGVFQQTFDGTYSGNAFIGDDGDDIFAGSAGNDILIGGNGEDLLIGRLGADTLTGGADADTFVVAAGDGGPSLALADLITDWEDGLDKIGLAGGLTFGDLTIGADGGNATISVGAEVLAVVDGAAGLIEATDFVGA